MLLSCGEMAGDTCWRQVGYSLPGSAVDYQVLLKQKAFGCKLAGTTRLDHFSDSSEQAKWKVHGISHADGA